MVDTESRSEACGTPLAQVETAAQVFNEHWDMIVRTINVYMRNNPEAEDVFQDVFLSLVQRPIPPGIRNVRQYLYRTIKNDVIDAVRRSKSYNERISRFAQRVSPLVVLDHPHDILVKAEETHRIFRLVEERLPRQEAQAVIQRYRYDKETADAAQAMGVNGRTFSRYLCMGIKKVRKLLSGEAE